MILAHLKAALYSQTTTKKKKISEFITVFNVWMHGEATQLLHHNTYSQVCLSSPGCKSWSVTGLKDVGPQIDSAVTCHNTRLCETHLLPQGVCSVASLCLWKQWHNSVKTFTWLSHTEGFSPDNSFCAVHHLIKSKALWNDSGRAAVKTDECQLSVSFVHNETEWGNDKLLFMKPRAHRAAWNHISADWF